MSTIERVEMRISISIVGRAERLGEGEGWGLRFGVPTLIGRGLYKQGCRNAN